MMGQDNYSATLTYRLHISGDAPATMLLPSVSSKSIPTLVTVVVTKGGSAIPSTAAADNGRDFKTSGSRCWCN